MANGARFNRSLDIVLWDATCGTPEVEELRHALECVDGLRVRGAMARPGDGVPAVPGAVVVLVAPLMTNLDPNALPAKLNCDACGPLIVAAIYADPDDLTRWIEWGASDYFTFPWHLADILPRIRKVAASTLVGAAEQSRTHDRLALDQMVGQSPAFRAVIDRIPAIAACEASVFITGETGTGKELCARAIHYLGRRERRPFVPLNCGAIPPDLVENELFGHAPGAYTGANSRQQGLVAEAECGTLFLDEVDSLPLVAQVKLLRFLQSKEYRPLGSPKTLTANVRLIAATNLDPSEAVKQGKLRQDLYYRLSVIPLQLPPLRERKEDIPLLAAHFLQRYAREFGKTAPQLSDEIVRGLMAYAWPGNVRELENVVARIVALAESPMLQPGSLDLPGQVETQNPQSLRAAKGQFERAYIEQKLRSFGGNISQAARAAGKNRRSFWELIRKHRIEVEKFRTAITQSE